MKILLPLAICLSVSLSSAASTIDMPTPLGPTTFHLTEDTPDAPHTYNDALKAIEAINEAAKHNNSVTLYVSPGVYWLDNPDDPATRVNPRGNGEVPYAAEITCDSLTIIGLGTNPEDIVWAVNRGQTQGALGNYTMIHFMGRAMRVENMTFGNYCNVDLVYPRDPSRNRAKRRDAIVQAQLGWCDGTDKLFARNCRFISRLNLCPLTGARRSLYKDCYFECTDDALTGSAIYLDCSFTFHSGKPLYSTPSTGAVFLNCDINSLTDGTQYLTKAPGMVTMIDTRFTSPQQLDLRWTRDVSPIRCYQSNITLNGRPVTIDDKRPELSAYLTPGTSALDAYKITLPTGETIYNTPNLLGGNDGWDPLEMLPTVKDAEATLHRPLTSLPVALMLETSIKQLAAEGEKFIITPVAKLWGDYDATLPGSFSYSWQSPSTVTLTPKEGKATGVSANRFPIPTDAIINLKTSTGLLGACKVNIAPCLKDAPAFATLPKVTSAKSTLRVDYSLSGSGQDESYIVWYRSTRPDLSDSIAVRHGHGVAGQTYPLSPADKGFYISATVHPRFYDSYQGQAASPVVFEKPISQRMISLVPKKENELVTSFAEIPLRSTGHGLPGFWHFDTYKPSDVAMHDWTPEQSLGWYYGNGVDAITGRGLIQSTKGARLSYTPSRGDSKAMRVELVAEPAKGPGQGFGSATGQYMDICLKFDPVSLSGYALRIERTPDYDKAVTFTLMSYHNGVATPITDPVPTSCFRNPCSIAVELREGRLTATASTKAKPVAPTDKRILPTVSLSAPVDNTPYSSLMIQHTGSAGSSATLLRDLHVTWE